MAEANPDNITALTPGTPDNRLLNGMIEQHAKEIDRFKRRLADADPLLCDLRSAITALSVLADGQFTEKSAENDALNYLINQAIRHGNALYAKLYPGGRVY